MYGLKRVKHRRNDALARTDWADVEKLLADHYRGVGYDVEHCGTGATGAKFDGGVDLRLRRGEEVIIVQCKHWNAMKVPHNDVLQLIGGMVNEGATGAILVTSGEFSKAAIEAATRQGHVQLVDGDELRQMLGPLPEPMTRSFMSEFQLSAARVGRHAGERLLGAAEDRIRGEVSRRSGGAMNAAVKIVLIKAALVLAMGFGLMLAVVMLFNFFLQQLQHIGSRNVPTVQQAERVVSQAPEPAEPAKIEYALPPPPVRHEPTPAEIREQQRKADEAMRVIEATTPEI
jgi:hypothetical protein